MTILGDTCCRMGRNGDKSHGRIVITYIVPLLISCDRSFFSDSSESVYTGFHNE